MPALGLAAVIGWNLDRHRRDKSTICCWVRLLPPALFLAGWAGFNVWFVPHVLRGYKRR